MSSKQLDNLVKTGQLKVESPTASEIDGLLRAAKLKLNDSKINSLSLESRFELAYSAAHSFSLAALRSHGLAPFSIFLSSVQYYPSAFFPPALESSYLFAAVWDVISDPDIGHAIG